ncbi:ubiquinol--cytochrome-c reductase subunit 6 [Mycoemilia scoparia]|uniref:Ubiquinol--cytochrome-c reductase subunit 6 n=1 Tax=Mycoemilia scoparia TaxID=417184 RepID=A0A9W8DPM5_9FUNG|nr:ubiquinol--cytochrome-c reductase subunit 6 [Mycoemilia scoparia]
MALFDWVSSVSFFQTAYADEQTPNEEKSVEQGEETVEVTEIEEAVKEEPQAAGAAEEEDEEEAEEEEEEEEEEDDEPEDASPAIRERCGETFACAPLRHHYETCAKRVEEGSSEVCAEEFLHFLHCVDQCAAPKIFAELK